MFKILADTCVWENLTKELQQRPMLNVKRRRNEP